MRAVLAAFVCACAPSGDMNFQVRQCSVVRLGGAGGDEISAMTSGADGALFVAGAFEGRVRFGARVARADGWQDGFVARVERSGEVRWVARIGSARTDRAWDVATSGGDAFATGLVHDRHCFVARLAGADGREVWRKRLAGAGTHLCRAIAVAPSGEVVVFGSTQGELVLDGQAAGGGTTSDFLLARLSATDGRVLSVRVIGGGGNDIGRAVVAGTDGDLYIGGQFSGEVAPAQGRLRLGDDVLTSRGDFDAVVARLRGEGAPVWARVIGGPGFDLTKALARAPAGGVLAVGPLQRPGDYGDQPPMFSGGFDGYLARHDAAGRVAWSHRFAGEDVQAHAIDVDRAGRVWVSGHFAGAVHVGGRRLRASGGTDAWSAAFTPDGRLLWASAFGGAGEEHGYAVRAGPDGIAIGGAFSGRTTLCGAAMVSRGATDAYILRVVAGR